MSDPVMTRDRQIDPAAVSKLMSFQSRWSQSLCGEGDFDDALDALAHFFGATTILLYRTGPDGRRRTIAGRDPGAALGARPLTHPLGTALLPASPMAARRASVWMLSELDPAVRPRLDSRNRDWMAARDVVDAAVIPLDLRSGEIDLLEFYLRESVTPDQLAILEIIAESAADVWHRRRDGVIERRLASALSLEHRRSGHGAARPHPMSPSNPCGLTAAETRICALIREGCTTAEITRQAGISEATVRSHLKNIYAKVQVTGKVGLVHALLSEERVRASAS